MKKVICACLACVMATVLLWGCIPEKETVKSEEKVHISFSFWEPSIKNDLENALTKIIKNYNELHPEVEIELIPKAVNGYDEWIKEQFASNKAPTIISNHVPSAIEYFENGLTVDLTEQLERSTAYCDGRWKDLFLETDAVKNLNGTSLPWFDFGMAYYYNVDLYENLSLKVPETWDEFMHNCEVIKERGVTPITLMAQKESALEWLGQYISTGLLGNSYNSFSEFDTNCSGSIDADEFKAIAASGREEEFKKEFAECQTAFWETLKKYAGYTSDAIETDENEAKTELLEGVAAHVMTGSWDIKNLYANSEGKIRIGIFKLPSFTTANHRYAGENPYIGGVQAVSVSKCGTEEEREAATDFLKFLFSEEQYRIFIDETMQLPTMKGYDTEKMKEVFTPTARGVASLIPIESQTELEVEYMLKIISDAEIDYRQAAENLYEEIYHSSQSVNR